MQELWGKVQRITPHQCFFESVDQIACTNSILLGPESVNSGSANWDNCGYVPWQVVYELNFLMGPVLSTKPGQRSQSTQTLLGQGCMHV